MPRICFVVMPFSETDSCTEEEWTQIFDTLIKPAVEGDQTLGYECRRSTATRGNIVRGIVEDLQASHVVVADLTDRNANVFYELGVRHALKDRTIIISQSKNHVPFDLQSYAYHIYQWRLPEGRDQFFARIRELLRDVDEKPERPDNPVSDFLHDVRQHRSSAHAGGAGLDERLAQLEVRLERLEAGKLLPAAKPASGEISLLDSSNCATLANQTLPEADLRALVRRTCRVLTDRLSAQVDELSKRQSSIGHVKQDDIVKVAESFIEPVQPLISCLEDFAIEAAQRDLVETVRGVMAIGACLVSLSNKKTGLRFTSGLPAFLALRLLLLSGAAAMHANAFRAVRTLLRDPLETELLGGQLSYRTLPESRDLFYPETFLGYANLPMHHFSDLWNTNLDRVFGDPAHFRESLISFLVLVAFFDTETGHQALYPGYRLIEDSDKSLHRLAARVLKNDEYGSKVASVFDEDLITFRRKWPERATKANEAALGGHYYFASHIPVTLPER